MSVKQVFNTSAELDYPTVLPTLDLDFANSKTLDSRITFTRASGGSYVGADGLIKYAGVNEARFDHDPVTGESLGLLVEEARTNLLLRGEQFDDAGWTKSNVTITANNIVAPDGTLTADKLVENTATNVTHFALQQSSVTSGISYTFSVFIKAAERTFVQVGLLNANSPFDNLISYVNLTNGSILSSTFGTVSGAKVSTISYPNGWYRVIVTAIVGSTTSLQSVIWTANSDALSSAARTYTGDGTSGLFIWGAQLEVGSFPTSYIPTVASTRTRAADNASITGKNFSEWYRQDEGTFITKAKYDGIPISGLVNRTSFATFSTENTVSSWNVWWESGGGNLAAYVVESPQSTYQAVLTSGLISINQTKKTASAYKLNDFAFTVDGASPSLDTSGTVPSNAKLFIGSLNGTSWSLDGTISQLTYYPKRLPNAQLQALTR
jgi:hypothetical protein